MLINVRQDVPLERAIRMPREMLNEWEGMELGLSSEVLVRIDTERDFPSSDVIETVH